MYQEFSVEDSVNEEGMVANPPGGSGGFSGSSPASGPMAGFDPVMKIDGRRKMSKGIWKNLSRTERREQKEKGRS